MSCLALLGNSGRRAQLRWKGAGPASPSISLGILYLVPPPGAGGKGLLFRGVSTRPARPDVTSGGGGGVSARSAGRVRPGQVVSGAGRAAWFRARGAGVGRTGPDEEIAGHRERERGYGPRWSLMECDRGRLPPGCRDVWVRRGLGSPVCSHLPPLLWSRCARLISSG